MLESEKKTHSKKYQIQDKYQVTFCPSLPSIPAKKNVFFLVGFWGPVHTCSRCFGVGGSLGLVYFTRKSQEHGCESIQNYSHNLSDLQGDGGIPRPSDPPV